MFAPDITTHQLADSMHAERQAHASLLHKISRDRADDSTVVDRRALRRATSRRLVATLAGTVLAMGIAAMAAAQVTDTQAPSHPTGGGVTLIR